MKREFNLTYVYYFLSVAETGSISHAAELLHITQSTLSGAITTLERELDIRLFDRIGKNRILLNRYGEQFYKRTKDAFFSLDQAFDELQDMKSTSTGPVRFSLPSSVLFPETIRRFTAANPNTAIYQSVTDLHYTRQLLMNGQLDFAVSYLPHPGNDFEWYPFLRSNLEFLHSGNSLLSGEGKGTLSQLEGQSVVLCTDNNLFPDLCHILFEQARVNPIYRYIGPSAEKAVYYILREQAIAVACPDLSRTLYDYIAGHPEVRRLSVPDAECSMGFVLRKNHYLPRAARDLIEQIARENGNISDFLPPEG